MESSEHCVDFTVLVTHPEGARGHERERQVPAPHTSSSAEFGYVCEKPQAQDSIPGPLKRKSKSYRTVEPLQVHSGWNQVEGR